MKQEKNVKTYKDYLREAISKDFKNYGYLEKYIKKLGYNEHGINSFGSMARIKPKKDYANI